MSVQATEAPTVEVGDFFVSSWGYDQTNITFFKVVSVSPSGKTVKVQEWENSHVGSNGYQDQVVPGEAPKQSWQWNEDFTESTKKDAPIKQRKLKYSAGEGDTKRYYLSWEYHYAGKWSGAAQSQTNSMFGH